MKRTALTMLALLAVVACGSDSTGPTQTVVGTYQLRTVNGLNLPVTLNQTTTERDDILDDEFTLNADHTYSEVGQLRATFSSGATTTVPEADAGTYSSANGAVAFTSLAGNGMSSGSVNGNQLTLILQGISFVYARQ